MLPARFSVLLWMRETFSGAVLANEFSGFDQANGSINLLPSDCTGMLGISDNPHRCFCAHRNNNLLHS